MVEQKPSKLTTRVRFPSPAPQFVDSPKFSPCGSVVEHSLGKGEVTRSIRVMGTSFLLVPNVSGLYNIHKQKFRSSPWQKASLNAPSPT